MTERAFSPGSEETAKGHGCQRCNEQDGGWPCRRFRNGVGFNGQREKDVQQTHPEKRYMAEACHASPKRAITSHPVFPVKENPDNCSRGDTQEHADPAGEECSVCCPLHKSFYITATRCQNTFSEAKD